MANVGQPISAAILLKACVQFHFHTFSEHSLNELHYSMECHLVYKVLNQGNPGELPRIFMSAVPLSTMMLF